MTDITQDSKQMGFFSLFNGQNETNNAAQIQTAIKECWSLKPFFALDVETTGLDPAFNQVIEIALVPFNMGLEPKKFDQLVSVPEPLPPEIIQITGINDAMLKGKPNFGEIAKDLLACMSGAEYIVAYNAKFDRPFIESELARYGFTLPDIPWIDPYVFVCDVDKYKKGKKLVDAAKRWGIELKNAHRAYDDAKAAGDLLIKMKEAIGSMSLCELRKKQTVLFWQNEHNIASFKKKNEWFVNR